MKFSLRWLQDYLELNVTPEQLFEKLTLAGTEVEHWEKEGLTSPHIVIGQVVSWKQHPNADRLRLCQINDGTGVRQVVCGGNNFVDGDKIPLALPGAQFPNGLTIKEAKLRGEASTGMMCTAKELSLSGGPDGILILPKDAPLGKRMDEYWPGDTFFDVEITPNRPDLLSYWGLAREIAATGAGKLKPLPQPKVSYPATKSDWQLPLEAGDAAPVFTATHLGEVKIGPSPEWLQEKIRATGHRPINNVVDITNFVQWEIGFPIHAFDAGTLKGRTIAIRYAREGEKLQTLDEKTYTLNAKDLVLADSTGALDVAGIMGGLPTAISPTTTELLLTVAWFDPKHIRRTGRRLGLSSDGSYRWERRVDPATVEIARDRTVQLFQELCGAKILSTPASSGTAPIIKKQVKLRPARAVQVIGNDIPVEKMETWLTTLGLKIAQKEATEITFEIPSFRADLEREIDLIEEIARLHGLNSVPARINFGLQKESDVDRRHDRVTALRQNLASRGWDECLTDSLTTLTPGEKETDLVALSNPLSELYTHLRPNLKHSLLPVAARNIARGVKEVRLFEVGRVYRNKNMEVEEFTHLGLLWSGSIPGSWDQAEHAVDYFDLKGLEEFLHAHVKIPATSRLTFGKVTAADLKAHGIKTPVFYAEYTLQDWFQLPLAAARYKPVPVFPAVQRDLAVVVEKSLPQEQVVSALRGAKIPELEKVELFDVFTDDEGKKIPADKKSLAYALTYRAQDRTLQEKEVSAWQDKIREQLKNSLGCSFREN